MTMYPAPAPASDIAKKIRLRLPRFREDLSAARLRDIVSVRRRRIEWHETQKARCEKYMGAADERIVIEQEAIDYIEHLLRHM